MIFKRFMEIKEEQLLYEQRQDKYLWMIDETLTKILEQLKRGGKDGKNNTKNKRK